MSWLSPPSTSALCRTGDRDRGKCQDGPRAARWLCSEAQSPHPSGVRGARPLHVPCPLSPTCPVPELPGKVLKDRAPGHMGAPPSAGRRPLAHRVCTSTESWYRRSYMQILRSTLGLGTHTGTSTATPVALKYSWGWMGGVSTGSAQQGTPQADFVTCNIGESVSTQSSGVFHIAIIMRGTGVLYHQATPAALFKFLFFCFLFLETESC